MLCVNLAITVEGRHFPVKLHSENKIHPYFNQMHKWTNHAMHFWLQAIYKFRKTWLIKKKILIN